MKITPFLWYNNNAEEAASFYVSVFPDSKILTVTPMIVVFQLAGQTFQALNGGPRFQFTEAISLFVDVDTQAEVDALWNKLIADGGAPSQCGWLKDKYGLSWQIIPNTLMKLMSDPDPVKANRVMQAMLKMSKIDIGLLQAAYDAD